MPPLPGFGYAVILRDPLFSLSGIRLYGGRYNLRQEGQNVFQHFDIATVVKTEDLLEALITKYKAEKAKDSLSECFFSPLHGLGLFLALCLPKRSIRLLRFDKMQILRAVLPRDVRCVQCHWDRMLHNTFGIDQIERFFNPLAAANLITHKYPSLLPL